MHGHLNVKPTNNPVQCNNQKTDHHLYYSQRDNLIIYDSLLFLIAVTEHRFCIDRPVAKSVTAVHCKAQLYRQKKNTIILYYPSYNKKYIFEPTILTVYTILFACITNAICWNNHERKLHK